VFSPIKPKTRHHCHVTGKYLSPVCQSCNLQLKCRIGNNEFFVPCFFHNSSAYDSHLIIKHLHKKQSKITVIPSNTEQFIGFEIDGMHYLDSYKFLSSSLDDLIKNLHNDGVDRFKYTQCTFGDGDANIFEKGTYPYEYMTSRDVFSGTVKLFCGRYFLRETLYMALTCRQIWLNKTTLTYKIRVVSGSCGSFVKLWLKMPSSDHIRTWQFVQTRCSYTSINVECEVYFRISVPTILGITYVRRNVCICRCNLHNVRLFLTPSHHKTKQVNLLMPMDRATLFNAKSTISHCPLSLITRQRASVDSKLL